MNLLIPAIRTDTFTSNIRAYVPPTMPTIISGTYGSESLPAIPAQAASCFNTVLAAISALGRPK